VGFLEKFRVGGISNVLFFNRFLHPALEAAQRHAIILTGIPGRKFGIIFGNVYGM
jgi:hypothetical protein